MVVTAKQAKERTENFYYKYIEDTILIAADNGQTDAKAYIGEDVYNKVKGSFRDVGYTVSYIPHTRTMHISWSNIV
jgi:hypothetical protein